MTLFLKLAIALVVLLLILTFLWWALIPNGRLPRFRVRTMRLRLSLWLYPGRGHASVGQLWLRWGRWASFRRSTRSRWSLSAWQRFRHPRETSIFLGRAHYRHGLRLPLEEHALLLAPPRTYKTAFLADVILHYPGPVLSTTTKADVFGNTSGIRQCGGRPVHVFNPQGIGGVPSTFRWSPIEGCQDPAVAIRRADGFANALSGGGGDNQFFHNAARSYLRAMFHAAALITDGDMRLVSQWAMTGTAGGAIEAENVLRQVGAGKWADELAQLRSKAEKTAETNQMVLGQALGFMSDPSLALAVLPAEDDGLDWEDFLADRGTLYLIADTDSDESPLAPLFAALASEVHYVAALVGQSTPGGRLDPPLLMALDEIVQVCPVPLPKWAADSGGKGIQIIAVTHGEAQLAGRWGDHGKQVILDTAGVKIILPGVTDTRTLEMFSKLCGQAALREHGQEHHSRHDILTPDMIRQLPLGRGLIIRGAQSPVIAKLPRVWKERSYKKAKRHGYATAQLAPAGAVLRELTVPQAPAFPRTRPADIVAELVAADPVTWEDYQGDAEPTLVRAPEAAKYPWGKR